jgi:hypothetical protein
MANRCRPPIGPGRGCSLSHRAVWIVLESVGIGAMPDAAYGAIMPAVLHDAGLHEPAF